MNRNLSSAIANELELDSVALNVKMNFNRKLPISDKEAQMLGSWSF